MLGVGIAVVIVAEYVVLLRTLGPDDPPDPPGATLARTSTEPPDELRSTGTSVRSVLQLDGRIRVTQWVRVPAAVDEITLASYAPEESDEPPVATGVEIISASGRVVLSEGEVGADPRTVPLGPARVLRLTYDLTGAMSMSGSVPGRALAASVALDVAYPGEAAATVEVMVEDTVEATGAEVLTLACGRDDLRPCGRPDDAGWRVRLSGAARDDRVSAQVDLP